VVVVEEMQKSEEELGKGGEEDREAPEVVAAVAAALA
jgi:hypothetical protein